MQICDKEAGMHRKERHIYTPFLIPRIGKIRNLERSQHADTSVSFMRATGEFTKSTGIQQCGNYSTAGQITVLLLSDKCPRKSRNRQRLL